MTKKSAGQDAHAAPPGLTNGKPRLYTVKVHKMNVSQQWGMTMSDRVMQEQLLDAWLSLSSVVSNNRLVDSLSFNEAFVLNLLYKQYLGQTERKLTATDLCRRTHILKSQMNGILKSLEKKQMIFRRRSQMDRRQVEVEINPAKLDEFIRCHENSLMLVERLLDRLTLQEGEEAIQVLNRLANGFDEVMKELEQTGKKQ